MGIAECRMRKEIITGICDVREMPELDEVEDRDSGVPDEERDHYGDL